MTAVVIAHGRWRFLRSWQIVVSWMLLPVALLMTLVAWRASVAQAQRLDQVRFERVMDGVVGGRAMTVRFDAYPGFDAAADGKSNPVHLLLIGLLASGLLFAIGWSLVRTRSLARRIAEKMTAALASQTAILKSVMASIPHSVFWKDRNCVYLGCNQKFAAAAGLKDPEQIVGKTDYDLPWTREEADCYRACDRKVMESGVDMPDFEESMRTAKGEQLVLLTSKTTLRNSADEVIGILGVFAEITQRKHADAILRSRLAAIDAAADMVVITDRDGKIEYVNPAFIRTTGYSVEETIGHTPRVLKSALHDAEFYRSLWKEITDGRVWHGELVNRRKDGSVYPEEMTITPVLDDAGRIVRFVAIKRDISARREREALERDRQSLRQAVVSMEQVLGVVGHELRTPLAGLRAISEFLLEDQASRTREADGFLRSMHTEVLRMSDTVNNLLEAARLNSGHATWNWNTFELREVCEAATASLQHLFTENVQVQCAVEPEDLSMQGDGDAVRRLITNLVNNAQKHTISGSIRVAITEEFNPNGHRYIRFAISDTGRGISPEVVARLGEAFALNAGIVGDHAVRGSGLGLAICRGIAAAHGGSISVESEMGLGTTITVRLRADLDGSADDEVRIEFTNSQTRGRTLCA